MGWDVCLTVRSHCIPSMVLIHRNVLGGDSDWSHSIRIGVCIKSPCGIPESDEMSITTLPKPILKAIPLKATLPISDGETRNLKCTVCSDQHTIRKMTQDYNTGLTPQNRYIFLSPSSEHHIPKPHFMSRTPNLKKVSLPQSRKPSSSLTLLLDTSR